MSERTVEHSTIVLERRFDFAPARVFAAWSNKEALLRWASPGEHWKSGFDRFDFRVGGAERSWFGPSDEETYVNEAIYLDIVENERIVSASAMTTGGTCIFVGLLTVQFHPAGGGSRLVMTEQGAFLDGHDIPANHQIGWNSMLDRLAGELAGGKAS